MSLCGVRLQFLLILCLLSMMTACATTQSVNGGGWLGVMVQTVTPELADSFGLRETKGALVADIDLDGPADKAGIKCGDVIIEFDGRPINKVRDLLKIVSRTPLGKKVTVRVLRNKIEKTFWVSLSTLRAEESHAIILNKKLADVGGDVAFYMGSVSVTESYYQLDFYFQYLGTYDYVFSKTKVDNIFADNLQPVDVQGFLITQWYKMNLRHNVKLPFGVRASKSCRTLVLQGIGELGKDIQLDLTQYDSLFPGKVRAKIPEIQVEKTPPTLTITDPELIQNIHRTEEYIVTISGKARDNEGVAFITINGENADLREDGRFMERVKLKIGKNEVIVKAVDVNDNVAEKKFFVMREEAIAEAEFSDVDFAPETGKRNPHGIGIVIGIEKYQYAPKVTFAYNDAEIFRSYLIKTFGFSRDNIYFKTNERATKGEFEKIFSKRGWLSRRASSKSDVVIYYAGHGGPDSKTKESFLIPHDIDPNYASTGYSLKQLYSDLSNIKAKSITVILDACFSGGTREAQMLLADARPIYIEIKGPMIPKNTVIFSAASGSEISSAYKQRLHGLFTYFFLRGLNGDADQNKDRKITVQEIHKFLEDHVPKQASRMGRDQTPQLIGEDRNRVLLIY